MLSFLTAFLIISGFGDLQPGSVGTGSLGAQAMITFHFRMEPSQQISYNIEDLGQGAYAMNIEGVQTGPDASYNKQRYLIMGDEPQVQLAMANGKLDVAAPEEVMLARLDNLKPGVQLVRK